MSYLTTVLALLILLPLLPTATLAQIQIEPILVKAERITTTYEKSPSDIKVFQRKDLEKTTSLTQLFEQESDLALTQSGPMGGNTSLFLRGADSSHVLVIIDGIVMNDPSNPNRQFDFGRLSLNNIERIEILKGSQGLLYGSNAIGGVILITSKEGKEKLTGSAQLDYGTYCTMKGAFNLQKKINQTALSFGADYLDSKGFSAANDQTNQPNDKDGQKKIGFNSNLNQTINSHSNLKLNYHYIHDQADLDKGGGNGNDDINDSQTTEEHYGRLSYSQLWDYGETEFSFNQATHHRILEVKKDSIHSKNSTEKTKGEMKTASVTHLFNPQAWLTSQMNLEMTHEKDQKNNFNENQSFFLNNKLEKNLDVMNLGIRIDRNLIFHEHLTYKLAFLHQFTIFQLKTSFSTGFRAPSLNQLFDSQYGNRNLKPETSQTFEIGFIAPFNSNHSEFVTTFFGTDLYNRLSFHPVTYVNINQGRARILGNETTLSVKLDDIWKTQVTTTLLRARDLSANNKLLRRPDIKIGANVSAQLENLSGIFLVDYTGKKSDYDNLGNTVMLESHLIFHMNFEMNHSERLSSYFVIRNLLNSNYEEVYGYNTGGRSVTLGLKTIF